MPKSARFYGFSMKKPHKTYAFTPFLVILGVDFWLLEEYNYNKLIDERLAVANGSSFLIPKSFSPYYETLKSLLSSWFVLGLIDQ